MEHTKEFVDKQLLKNRIQQILNSQARGWTLENIGSAWKLRSVPKFHPPITEWGGFYFDKYKKCIYAFTIDTDVGDWEDYAQEYIITSWHNPDPVQPYVKPDKKSIVRQYKRTKGPPGPGTNIPGPELAEIVHEMMSDGHTQAQIARAFQVSQSYICTIKKKYLTTS